MQQHNTWGKDRNDLASLAGQVLTEGYEDKDDLDNFEASKSEDAENSEVSQLLASVRELDAVSMEEFLYGLAETDRHIGAILYIISNILQRR